MQRGVYIILLLISFLDMKAQDTLMLHNGKRIPYLKIYLHPHAILIKNMTRKKEIFEPDSVFGFYETLKEQAYFVKSIPNMDSSRSFDILDRLDVGKITLYSSNNRFQLYMEKQNRIEKVFDLFESSSEKLKTFETYASFIADDVESSNYIRSQSTKYNYKEIVKVVPNYNQRNYEPVVKPQNEAFGKIYLYRTQFQKVKEGVKIKLNGEVHDLYMQDFIQLQLPIHHASKLTFYAKDIKTEILLSGLIQDQFFELDYDSSEDNFVLSPKYGTELHFEFNKIREKVEKRIQN